MKHSGQEKHAQRRRVFTLKLSPVTSHKINVHYKTGLFKTKASSTLLAKESNKLSDKSLSKPSLQDKKKYKSIFIYFFIINSVLINIPKTSFAQ